MVLICVLVFTSILVYGQTTFTFQRRKNALCKENSTDMLNKFPCTIFLFLKVFLTDDDAKKLPMFDFIACIMFHSIPTIPNNRKLVATDQLFNELICQWHLTFAQIGMSGMNRDLWSGSEPSIQVVNIFSMWEVNGVKLF